MKHIIAILIGFCMDLLFGDPAWIIHPVVIMGKGISFFDHKIRPKFFRTPKGERIGGGIMVICMILGTAGITCGGLVLLYRNLPWAAFVLECIWSWQVLAMRGLKAESMKVYEALKQKDLSLARRELSMIVGRDTEVLQETGITKAAVETVAENFSDGVIAPLFWLFVGGPAAAMTYKAINTMDSMVGYKNEKYLNFGCVAAKTDDLANLIPARLAALLLIAASGVCGLDLKAAFRIWRRDRFRHASPNSAQTEAAAAGALGIELGGPAYYFGEYHDKPTIGAPIREPEIEDICRINRLMYAASFLGLLAMMGVRLTIMAIWM